MRIASQLPVPAAAARVMPGPSGSDVEDGAAALVGIRRAIDLVDGASLLLLAVRGRLATGAGRCKRARGRPILDAPRERSEEHTSELQSLMRTSYAGFCLKKKQTKLVSERSDKTDTCKLPRMQ